MTNRELAGLRPGEMVEQVLGDLEKFGEVVEVDQRKGRVRVQWTGSHNPNLSINLTKSWVPGAFIRRMER